MDSQSPAIQVAEAVINTAISPTPESILNDIELMMTIYREIKDRLKGVHPTAINVLKALL